MICSFLLSFIKLLFLDPNASNLDFCLCYVVLVFVCVVALHVELGCVCFVLWVARSQCSHSCIIQQCDMIAAVCTAMGNACITHHDAIKLYSALLKLLLL